MLIFGVEVRDFRRENYGKTTGKPPPNMEFMGNSRQWRRRVVASLATHKTIDILPCFFIVSAIKWLV